MFKPGIANTNKEGKLAAWSSISSIDYIKNPEKVTHNADYVLDLSFSNIPFIIISIQTVGIKGSHVWSHDQGDRPNHVTNLP
jgi:hypothetical protein